MSCRSLLLAAVLIIVLVVVIGAVALGAASFGSAPQPASAAAPNSIAFVGCSNTWQAVTGYYGIPNNKGLFWDPQRYHTDSGTIDRWAEDNSNFWNSFDNQLQRYGPPQIVWVQLCEQYNVRPVPFSEVASLFANLKRRVPNALYYVSAINSYQPINFCPFMGPQGQGESDTQAWRDQLVQAGTARRGPDMGPLNAQNSVGNGCHMNDQGMREEGQQLVNFFDKGAPASPGSSAQSSQGLSRVIETLQGLVAQLPGLGRSR